MLLTFKGGLHVPDGKELTRDKPSKTAPVPEILTVPLLQHIGAPLDPLVKKKDEVLLGQPLGKARGPVSALVHSPVSGTVKDVGLVAGPAAGKVPAVILSNDGEDRAFDGVGVYTAPGSFSREQLVEKVLAAGIVGLGGATFPSHIKLSPPEDKPIDTVIVNGAECEPLLTCDHRLMVEHPDAVIHGAELVRKMVGARDLILATEDNKRDVAELLEAKILELGVDARVVVVATKYPQGGEKQLIKAILGREVPTPRKRGLPMDVGVVVHNVGTCHAIWSAVTEGRPLYERLVTVVGDGVREPGNYRVRIGTPIGVLLDDAGLVSEPAGLVLGGPMMGTAVFSRDVPVTKGTSGVLVRATMDSREFHDCIRCTSCVKVCPMHLMPLDLSAASEAGRPELAEQWHVDDCIECGCCAYICPSHRPIVQQIRHAKAALRRLRAAARAG